MKCKTLIFLIVFVFLSNISKSQSVLNEQKQDFKDIILDFISDSVLANSSIGFYAIDVNSGEEIAEINPDLLLSPASAMKIFTTAAALEIFEPDFTFKTKIEYSGIIQQNGILKGNIYIKGGGDPCFMSHNFNSNYYNPDVFLKIVEEIKKTGIKKVDGSIVGDATYYSDNSAPSTWILADVANYYGASPWALSILDNEYKLYFKTGSEAGDSTFITNQEPKIPFQVFKNFVKTNNISGDQSVIYGGLFDNYRIITGELPLQKTNFEVKGAISDPPLYAATILKQILKENGIEVSDSVKAIPGLKFYSDSSQNRKCIYTIESPQLKDIIYFTNIKSVNLYAEHLLRQIGLKNQGIGSNSAGIDCIINFWEKTTGKLLMFDGSGLSRFNAVSAKQLVYVLKYMKKESKNFDVFYNSLPVASKSGSLAGMFSSSIAENNLRAKSGYMTGVRSYAGYLKTKSSKELAFAIIINNYLSNPSRVKEKIEQFLIKLSSL